MDTTDSFKPRPCFGNGACGSSGCRCGKEEFFDPSEPLTREDLRAIHKKAREQCNPNQQGECPKCGEKGCPKDPLTGLTGCDMSKMEDKAVLGDCQEKPDHIVSSPPS